MHFKWQTDAYRLTEKDGGPWLRSHPTALEVKRNMPARRFGSYFKFSFVRNPWDRLVSIYHRRCLSDNNERELIRYLGSFHKWIEWKLEATEVSGPESQARFILDSDGRELVDYVGRVERLEEDFRDVCDRLGIRETLGHFNASPNRKHRDYRIYYDARTRKLVEDALREEIERFRYTF